MRWKACGWSAERSELKRIATEQSTLQRKKRHTVLSLRRSMSTGLGMVQILERLFVCVVNFAYQEKPYYERNGGVDLYR